MQTRRRGSPVSYTHLDVYKRQGVEFTKAWVLNWSKVAQADWFAIPKLVPVKIVFDMRAILPVLIMFIVTAVETVGDILSLIHI